MQHNNGKLFSLISNMTIHDIIILIAFCMLGFIIGRYVFGALGPVPRLLALITLAWLSFIYVDEIVAFITPFFS